MSPGSGTRVDVTRTYLELRSPFDLRRSPRPAAAVELVERAGIAVADYLALYRLVGERWHWRDRLAWPEERLARHLTSPGVHVRELRAGGHTAGYFELARHDDGAVEIMYFGLAPAFIGQGLGGWLLTRAVDIAFDMGADRVVLNTCTLDAPQALPNYLARGFRIVREEVYQAEL